MKNLRNRNTLEILICIALNAEKPKQINLTIHAFIAEKNSNIKNLVAIHIIIFVVKDVLLLMKSLYIKAETISKH